MAMTQPTGEERERDQRDLEARVRTLEAQVTVLTAALDAASRLRISTPTRISPDIRIAGGRKVRRILESGRLVEGYPELPHAD